MRSLIISLFFLLFFAAYLVIHKDLFCLFSYCLFCLFLLLILSFFLLFILTFFTVCRYNVEQTKCRPDKISTQVRLGSVRNFICRQTVWLEFCLSTLFLSAFYQSKLCLTTFFTAYSALFYVTYNFLMLPIVRLFFFGTDYSGLLFVLTLKPSSVVDF